MTALKWSVVFVNFYRVCVFTAQLMLIFHILVSV